MSSAAFHTNMIRALLFLSLARWAACLLRGERGPHGLTSVIKGDDLNYKVSLGRLVFQEAEIQEVTVLCRSYDVTPAWQTWQLSEVNVSDTAAEDIAVNDSLVRALGKELKLACFGATWDGVECLNVAAAMRHAVFPRLASHTGDAPKFEHLRFHARAPPMKTFRGGGGNMADVSCRQGDGQAHLYYRHIYKSGGLAIQKNLAILANAPYDDFVDPAWAQDDYCGSYMERNESGALPKPVLFTFVRDPMDKFIAGFKEIASRSLIDEFRGERVGSIEHAKYFLDNVFHGACDNGHVLLQIQSMMGPACESKFDFVGKLEHLMPHWEALGAHAGCTEKLVWPKEFKHASDDGDKGAEKALRAALAEHDGKLMLSLCLWLLPDYIGFDYPLPEPCKGYNFMLPERK